QGESELHTIRQIVSGTVPDPTTLVPGYPPGLARILSRAIAVDPSRRMQSALELALALDELAAAERYPTSALALARWLRRMFGEPESIAMPDMASTEVDAQPVTDLATTPVRESVPAPTPLGGIATQTAATRPSLDTIRARRGRRIVLS